VTDDQFLGISLALVAAFSWGFSSAFFKSALKSNKSIRDLLFSITIRGAVAVPFIAVMTLLLFSNNSLSIFLVLFSQDLFPLLILSSIFVTIGDVLFFGALQRIEVSRAQPVASIYPLFTAILLILLGVEVISLIVVSGIFLLIIGISLVSQQNNESSSSDNINDIRKGLVMAVIAAIFWSFAIITVRLILEDPMVNVFALATIRFGILTIITAFFWLLIIFNLVSQQQEDKIIYITTTRKDVLVLGIGGILGWGIGAISFFSSIDLIGASRATPISSINPIIAIILGIFVLKEELTLIQVFGILLVVCGSILVSFF
jgi:DME family drug/metabolite transporter